MASSIQTVGDDPPEVLCSIRKNSDVVMVLRLMSLDGVKYLDLRDYLTARDEWGRGYWFDADPDELIELATTLLDVADRMRDSDV